VAPPPLHTCETTMNEPGCLSFEADPAVRLAACRAYWDASPLAYTPNPLQLTAPAHGLLYGETTFVTTTPPSVFDSIRIDSKVKLKGIQELWITAEPADAVDPARRGPALLQGVPGPGGLGIVHIDLSPPVGSTVVATGTAALEVELDDYPIRF
jgi:hypothetical protein